MKKQKGFSLIEILVVIMIVAVLSLLAMPMLQNHSLKAHRVEARNALQEAATKLHQVYLVNKGYKGFLDSSKTPLNATQWLEKNSLNKAPVAGATRYEITIEITDNEQGYNLTATAVNRQANDKCKTITLNSRGVKGGTMPNECWR